MHGLSACLPTVSLPRGASRSTTDFTHLLALEGKLVKLPSLLRQDINHVSAPLMPATPTAKNARLEYGQAALSASEDASGESRSHPGSIYMLIRKTGSFANS